MGQVTIKETCSCGATLNYEERFDKPWEGSASYRQASFHSAHASCREAFKYDVPSEPQTKRKLAHTRGTKVENE